MSTAKVSGSMTATKYLVFVYGTLKRGGTNHHVIERGRFRGVANTEPQFRLLDACGGAFPYMVAGDRSIQGELFELDGATLYSLDQLEGYRPNSEVNHYNRETIMVTVGNERREALVYVLNEKYRRAHGATEFDGNNWIPVQKRRHK